MPAGSCMAPHAESAAEIVEVSGRVGGRFGSMDVLARGTRALKMKIQELAGCLLVTLAIINLHRIH